MRKPWGELSLSTESRRMLRSVSTAGLFSLALAGCQTVTSGCPPLVTYSAEFQREAAGELRTLSAGSRVATMVVDYGKMRDACRAVVSN